MDALKKLWFILVALVIGIMIGVVMVRSKLPESLDVMEKGKVKATAILDVKQSRILNVKGGEDPGAYLGFPLYELNEFESRSS